MQLLITELYMCIQIRSSFRKWQLISTWKDLSKYQSVGVLPWARRAYISKMPAQSGWKIMWVSPEPCMPMKMSELWLVWCVWVEGEGWCVCVCSYTYVCVTRDAEFPWNLPATWILPSSDKGRQSWKQKADVAHVMQGCRNQGGKEGLEPPYSEKQGSWAPLQLLHPIQLVKIINQICRYSTILQIVYTKYGLQISVSRTTCNAEVFHDHERNNQDRYSHS